MEELGFHRKYRPKTLSEYIGNEKLKQSVNFEYHLKIYY